MESEPEEDEEQAAAAAAADEAPDESTVTAARVDVAGHEVAANSTTLDVSGWKLTAEQVREVAGALPQLLCVQELVLDEVPVSGSTPRKGGFRYGLETRDADLETFRALCEALRACQALTSLSLKTCYLGPQALAVLAEVVFRDARAVLTSLSLSANTIGGSNPVWFPISVLLSDVDDINAGTVVRITSSMRECKAAFDACVDDSGETIIDWDDDMEKYLGSTVTLTEVDEDGTAAFEDCGHIQALGQAISNLTHLDISDCSFTPASIKAFASSVTWAKAALNEVNMSGNPLTGGDVWGDGSVQLGTDVSGVAVLFPSMTAVITLNVSNCGLGPSAMPELSKLVRDASAVLTSVNCLKNPLGDEGLAALVTAVEASSVGSICGLTEGQTTVDWSQQGLGPFDCKIIAADFRFRRFNAVINEVNVSQNPIGVEGGKALANVIPQCLSLRWIVVGQAARIPVHNSEVTSIDANGKGLGPGEVTVLAAAISTDAVLASLTLSGNKISGTKRERGQWIYDADLSGFTSLCQVLGRLKEVNLSDCHLGPTSMPELAKVFRDATAALNSLTVSSTGNMRDQKSYTLTVGEPAIDLSSKNLGPADVNLLTVWMQRPEVFAAIEVVNVIGNAIGEAGAKGMIEVFNANPKLQSLVGVKPGSTSADFSQKNMQPHDCIILAHELKASRAAAAIKSLTVDSTGSPKLDPRRYVPSAVEASGPRTYALTVGEAEIDLSNKNLGPADVTLLTAWIQRPEVSAVLASLNLSGNASVGMATYIDPINALWTMYSGGGDTINREQYTKYVVEVAGYSGLDDAEWAKELAHLDGDITVGIHRRNFDLLYTKYNRNATTDAKKAQITGTWPLGEGIENSSITRLDISNCGIRPAICVKLASILARATPFTTVLARVSVLSNPIGVDGADALIQVFEQNTNLRTLLGIEEGVTELNLSEKNVDPGQAKILAAELKASRATAVLTDLNVSGNPLTGKMFRGRPVDGKDIFGVSVLFPVMTRVVKLNVSECGLGSTSMPELAKLVRDAPAVLAHLVICQNKLGSEGGTTLVEAIKTSNLESISIGKNLVLPIKGELDSPTLDASNQDIDPGYVIILAWWLSTPASAAVVKKVALSGNALTGGEPSYKTDIYDVSLIQTDGKDISGVSLLFPSMTQVTELDVSNCGLGATSMPELAKLVSDATAALASLTMSGNFPAGRISKYNNGKAPWLPGKDFDEWTELCDAVQGSQITEWNICDCYLGPGAMTILSIRLSAAAIKSLALRGNDIIGLDEHGRGTEDLSGFEQLCAVIGKLHELNLSKCNLNPAAITIFATQVTWAKAALASLTLDDNDLFGTKRYLQKYKHEYLNMKGWIAFCKTLKSSNTLVSFSAADIDMSPEAVVMLADAIKAMAAVKKVVISHNFIFGSKASWDNTQVPDIDADQSGWAALCDALPGSPVEELDVAGVGMGVSGVTSLAKAMSAGAAVKKVVLSNNKLFGADERGRHTIDVDQSGWSTLCEALPGSSVQELGVAGVGMGVTGLTSLAKAISSMAVLASLNCSSNKLTWATGTYKVGDKVHVKRTLAKPLSGWGSISHSSVGEIVSIDGSKCKIDFPEQKGWIGVIDELTTEGDEEEDLSGLIALCTVLGYLTEVNLSECFLGPASMAELAKVFSDGDAVLARVSVLSNPIGADGADALIEVFNQNTNIRTLLGNEEGVTELNLSNEKVDPAQAKILAAELKASRALAALASLTVYSTAVQLRLASWMLDQDEYEESENEKSGRRTYTLTVGDDAINLSQKNLSPADVTLVATWMQRPEVSAALASLDVSLNDEIKIEGAEVLANAITLETSLQNIITGPNSTNIPIRGEQSSLDLSEPLYPGDALLVAATLKCSSTLTHVQGQGICDACAAAIEQFIDKPNLENPDRWKPILVLLQALDSNGTCASGESVVHWVVQCFEQLASCCSSWVSQDATSDEQLEWWLESLDVVDTTQLVKSMEVICGKVGWRNALDGLREKDKWPDGLTLDKLMKAWFLDMPPSDATTRAKATIRSALVEGHLQLCAMPAVLQLLQRAAASNPLAAATIKDHSGSTPCEIAKGSKIYQLHKWGLTFGALLRRYRIVGHKVHSSKTCLVIFAFDVLKERHVALKLMANADEWQREIDMRKTTDGAVLDASHVVSVLDNVQLEAADVEACAESSRLKGPTPYIRMLVMPQARRDLSDLLSHDRVAGRDKKLVLSILRQVAEHLHYLHDTCGRIHGDLKPHNIVEVELADGTLMWVLIDLDASCALGTLAGQKVTSSAYFPPELARRELRKVACRGELETVLASVQLEMWYFGLLVLQLCMKDAPTLWQSTQADDILRDADMHTLAYGWEAQKLHAIGQLIECGAEWAVAADLTLWCLQGNAARRPESMEQVFAHKFFDPDDGELRYLESAEETMDAFLHRQVMDVSEAIRCCDSDTLGTMFDRGGVHVNMVDRGVMPLHHSAHSDCAEAPHILQLLLDEIPACTPLTNKRVILDALVGYGYTAYMVACELGNLAAVELLVDAGCSTGLQNSFGRTGLELAVANGRTDVYNWLQARASEHSLSFFYGAEAKECNLVGCYSLNYLDLRHELERREMRPDVKPDWREDLEISADRLTFWAVKQIFDSWRRIGGGAFGDVFLVSDVFPPLQLGDGELPVFSLVVKVVVAADNAEALVALRDEIKTLCALRHRNIVRVFGFSFTERPVTEENDGSVDNLRQAAGCRREKNLDVLVGAVRLAKQHQEQFAVPLDPELMYHTRRDECLAAGRSAREPTWALLLEKCDCDLNAPIYNRDPWSDGAMLSWMRRLNFAQQMASGLAYIHANGQVHWDLKPGNILMKCSADGEWTLKIADFGMGDGDPENEAESVGTPEYMAPEAWRGRPVAASDVFSFGLILWELCSQKRVHEGFPHFDLQLYTVDEHIPNWMATQDARPEIPPKCPQLWALLMQACWAAEPAMRPNFVDIAAALSAMQPMVATWSETATASTKSTQTVQEWLQSLGLGACVELFIDTSGLQEGTKYLDGLKTIEDDEFQELLEDLEELDEAVDEMVGEDENHLAEDEAAKLKVALRALLEPASKPGQAPATVPTVPTVQQWLQSLGLGASVELFIDTSGLQEGTKYLEGLKTIEDDEFRELLEDLEELDEAVDEMVGEDENHLTEGKAAKLKAALHDLWDANTEPQPESDAGPWDQLRALLQIEQTTDSAQQTHANMALTEEHVAALAAEKSALDEVAAAHDVEIAKMRANKEALETKAADLEQALAAKDEALAAKDVELKQALATVTSKDEALAAKEAESKQASAAMTAKDEALAAKDAELEQALATVTAAKDEIIAAKEAELQALAARLAAFEGVPPE